MALMGYPGVKFLPTDKEILTYFLPRILCDINQLQQVAGLINDENIYLSEPWNLSRPFLHGVGTEVYYFTPIFRQSDGKGKRANRRAGAGTWKMTGSETPVSVKDVNGVKRVVGHVTHHCYIRDGEKVSSTWVMDEYTITDDPNWGICRIKLNSTTEQRQKKMHGAMIS